MGEENQKDVVCFVYHRFGDDRFPSTNISPSDFEAHLKYLVDHDFQVLSLSDAIAYLKSDAPRRKTVVITIDDGYKSFFSKGLPLLRKYQLPATLFINTETVGGSDYMNWGELRKATEGNVEIGNHTHSHAYFMNLESGRRVGALKAELATSQALIEKNLNITPSVFSYPYGELDQNMVQAVRDFGFKAAVAQNSGVLSAGDNFFTCPRFPMSESYAAIDRFREKANMLPLEVTRSTPVNFSTTQESTPSLTLVFNKDSLRLDQLRCFVQGGDCQLEVSADQGNAPIKLRSKQSIRNRRRTLYTVTVPDENGKWHWYSHLWINSDVK
jgi:peptidoglycan/xylan/chitin deacetylase (PgdA/CDA1 family)